MEKLRFTFRFIILLVALPVVMFTELTRSDKGTVSHKQNATEKAAAAKSDDAMLNHSPFMQAVLN